MQLQRSKKREEMHTFAVGGLKIPHDFPNWIPGSAVWPSVKSVERERDSSKVVLNILLLVQIENFQKLKDTSPY